MARTLLAHCSREILPATQAKVISRIFAVLTASVMGAPIGTSGREKLMNGAEDGRKKLRLAKFERV